jgi:hypothetical protein
MNRWATLLVSGSLLLAGCGGPANKYDATVTGTVTIDGELASSGTVTFQPLSKEGKIAIGRINTDGSYSLRTGQGDLQQVDGGTVAPGEYVVTLSITAPPVNDGKANPGSPPIPGPSLVASKYKTKETSDLRRTVKPGPQVMVLELERAEEEPAEEEKAEVEVGEEVSAESVGDAATDTPEPASPAAPPSENPDSNRDEKAEQ